MVRTVVTREAEWDDVERDKMLALAYYEAGICDCGQHRSLARDKTQVFQLEVEKCPLCAELEAQGRVRQKADEAVKKRLKDFPERARPEDGRKLYVRHLTPDEVAARSRPTE